MLDSVGCVYAATVNKAMQQLCMSKLLCKASSKPLSLPQGWDTQEQEQSKHL